MSELKTISLDELELVGVTQSESEMDVSVNFPFSPAFPATTGIELEGGHNVVYFEIEPGKELGTHTDSPEELIICLDGDEVEAWAGGTTGVISAGDLAVIPPMAPHGFRNTGSVTARFLGVFSDSTTVSEFEADLEPFEERTVKA
ncbi:cupin domain-containing protein [Natrinema sp. DC36]|uniref:cupin domain-containing protein n=1 Tax=Natrinema sp. DC36 TaxID=2878680 RepID=UPI001CF00F57|nr:cupin domain-containing protein [Natrinema sp. DC36]